jgi:DNA-directed RNA polymerase subunit beta
VPESFKVLIKELQSLALDIKVLSDTREEILIGEDDDDIVPLDVNIAGTEDAAQILPPAAEDEADFDSFEEFDDIDDDLEDDLEEDLDGELDEDEDAEEPLGDEEPPNLDEALEGLDEDLGELAEDISIDIDKDID